jgi:hypothetical protein
MTDKWLIGIIAAFVLAFGCYGVWLGDKAPSQEQRDHPPGWSQQEQDRRRAALDACLNALPGIEKLDPKFGTPCFVSSGYYDSYSK